MDILAQGRHSGAMGTSDDWKDCFKPCTQEEWERRVDGEAGRRLSAPEADDERRARIAVRLTDNPGVFEVTDRLTPDERAHVEHRRSGGVAGVFIAIIDRLAPRPGGER